MTLFIERANHRGGDESAKRNYATLCSFCLRDDPEVTLCKGGKKRGVIELDPDNNIRIWAKISVSTGI